jgi:hypothetical protein
MSMHTLNMYISFPEKLSHIARFNKRILLSGQIPD